MWELTLALWDSIVELLGHPTVRAFTTIIAIASAAAGLWAAFKAQKVLHTHRQQIFVSQRQSLNEQWQRINAAVLSNESVLRTVSNVVGADDIEHFRQLTFLETLVNLLFQAWASREHGTLNDESYNAHFASVAYFFRNRAVLFSPIALESEYPVAFVEDCKRRFAELTPLTRIQMSKEFRDYANLLDQADESERQGDGKTFPSVPPKTEPPSVRQ